MNFKYQISNLFSVLIAIIAVFLMFSFELKRDKATESAVNIEYKVFGLNFSPYIDGQDPNLNFILSEQQIRERMEIIAPYTEWVRTFSCINGLEKSGEIAHNLGLKIAVGAWLGSDTIVNGQEIDSLISVARRGEADILIIGSEVLLRNDLSEAQLLKHINRVNSEFPDIPVTCADVYGELLEHPAIVNACDVVFANYYPYWEGIDIDTATATIHHLHNKLVVISGDKPVYVSEAGWPDAGNIIGKAIPSSENATAYFINFVSWARANKIKYFYFEAFDESWKANREGIQGAHWGIFDKSGQLKTGMMPVFEGDTVSGIWNIDLSPGGDGTPTIEFTSVPALGSFNNLEGRIWHVNPFYYKIAVYICVSGSWWTKPYFGSPLTSIKYNGTWVCDITTGGSDASAMNIIAYLVPWNSNPPLVLGGSTLPEELETISLAKLEVQREATNSPSTQNERQIQIISGNNQIQIFNSRLFSFQAYDLSGNLVYQKKISDDKKQIVSTEKWPVGIYILKLQDTEGVQVIKFPR